MNGCVDDNDDDINIIRENAAEAVTPIHHTVSANITNKTKRDKMIYSNVAK